MTVRSKFMFVAKAHADGTPWIAFTPVSGPLRGEGLPPGIYGFDLPKGTTGQRAKEIADFLDQNIDQLSFTALEMK